MDMHTGIAQHGLRTWVSRTNLLFDGYGDGTWHFFRCPYGLETIAMRKYIHYLQCKIFDLECRVEDLQSEVNANPWAVNITGDLMCTDPWCKYPYHHNKDPPLSPPSSSSTRK
ncbi:hypothetical protein SETIT_5G036700v2 [Setaria italica]|uniref:Uncharacterized protein n=1 Tax=Setaria italica TaxID=4555 RepID=A0A368R1B3_SETIT|nr:hypothetical protein SETIT_5G036700v2 [Setaria italica]